MSPAQPGTRPVRLRAPARTAALLAAGLLALTACGGEDPAAAPEPSAASSSSTPSESAAATPSESAPAEPEGTVVDVTVEGDSVEPLAESLRVGLGEQVTLRVTSDRDGELHVHSTPEQYVEFGAGSTEKTVTFEQPGVVEIEEHESGKLVLKVQVR